MSRIPPKPMTDSNRNNVKMIRGMHSKEIAPNFASKVSPAIIDRVIVTMAVAMSVNIFEFLLIFFVHIHCTICLC